MIYSNLISGTYAVSSVVKPGGGELLLPHWHAEHAKSTFLALLRPIFALKAKTAPLPLIGFGYENVSILIVDFNRIRSRKLIPTWVKIFSFLRSSPDFGHKTGPNQSENRSKFGFTPPKQLPDPPPTNCKFLATHLRKLPCVHNVG